MAKATYSLDVYTHPVEMLVIAVRRLEPYTDDLRVFHCGTGKGLNIWFSKMKFARSGKASAAISAMTSTSHALFFTDLQDWTQQVGYKTGISRDAINTERRLVAKDYAKLGFIFVGNEDHKLGEQLGVKKPGYTPGKRLTVHLKAPELRTRINKMTEYVKVDYKLTVDEIRDLVKRCHGQKTDDPIVTISDLFNEICTIVIAKMP